MRSINILESKATDAHELTVVGTTNYMKSLFVDELIPFSKTIDLKPALKKEDWNNAVGLYPFKALEAKVDGKRIVLTFTSFTYMKGRVVLNDQLKVKSIKITEKSE